MQVELKIIASCQGVAKRQQKLEALASSPLCQAQVTKTIFQPKNQSKIFP
jgi:hypothetical protein